MGQSTFPPPEKASGSSGFVLTFGGAPHPEGEEFARRLANFSFARAVVFTSAVALVAAVLAQGAGSLRLTYSLKVALGVLAIAFASAVAQWWASRRRFQMHTTALVLIVLDQGLFGGIAYVTGGVASGATSLFGIACLVGGLLLGVPGAVAAALAGGIFFSLLVLATQGENGIRPSDQPAYLYQLSEGQAAYYYVFNILMLLLVGLLASYLAERLQRAGGALKHAQKRVEQAERMAALGRLAAGLAHEIRNPLGSISGSIQMLKEGADREEDRDLCDIVLRESGRLDELVSDMMDLSRNREAEKVDTDLGMIVRDVVELSKKSGRVTDVELVRLGVDSVWIHADPGQLRQLIWNLVRNALQATASGGQVRVELREGPPVRLFVEDDGVGIDSEAMDRLFDAFFTTRSKGTGLGLAVVKRIADEHQFSITVTSDTGDGTVFEVNFGASVPNPVVAPA